MLLWSWRALLAVGAGPPVEVQAAFSRTSTGPDGDGGEMGGAGGDASVLERAPGTGEKG